MGFVDCFTEFGSVRFEMSGTGQWIYRWNWQSRTIGTDCTGCLLQKWPTPLAGKDWC